MFFSPTVSFNIDPIPDECYNDNSALFPWYDDDGLSYYYAFGITWCLSAISPLPAGAQFPIPTCLNNLQDCCWGADQPHEEVKLKCYNGFHDTCTRLCCGNNPPFCINAHLRDCTCHYIAADESTTSAPSQEPSTDRQTSTIQNEGPSGAQIRYVSRSKYSSLDIAKILIRYLLSS